LLNAVAFTDAELPVQDGEGEAGAFCAAAIGDNSSSAAGDRDVSLARGLSRRIIGASLHALPKTALRTGRHGAIRAASFDAALKISKFGNLGAGCGGALKK